MSIYTLMPGSLYLSGASDDLVEAEGVLQEEWGIDSNYQWTAVLRNRESAVKIGIEYNPDGLWEIRVAQADESIPLPPWEMLIAQHPATDYSARLEVRLPEQASLDVWEGDA